jgi:nickel/cobalt transporter (NicO) family protein
MFSKIYRNAVYLVLLLVSAAVIWLTTAQPSPAHWADMSAAEIVVKESAVQINLTYPTGLTPFADDNQNGQLAKDEIQAHAGQLQTFLGEAIRLTSSDNQTGSLTVQSLQGAVSPSLQAAPSSHSTLQLTYAWPQPIRGFKLHYNLFLPGVATASCLATILQNHQLQTFVFTPKNQVLALTGFGQGNLLLAIGGAILWGAIHSLSPGHGKTLVGAYLVGSRATPRHAIFLALTTTVTHTLGIFGLGCLTLFASRYIVPEQLYPWMSLASGLVVVAIGLNLLLNRWNQAKRVSAQARLSFHPRVWFKTRFCRGFAPIKSSVSASFKTRSSIEPSDSKVDSQVNGQVLALVSESTYRSPKKLSDHDHHFPDLDHHSHSDHGHNHHGHHHHHHHIRDHSHSHGYSQNHSHSHIYGHSYDHSHSHDHKHDQAHYHSHLPPDADGSPVTWRSLLALGISGGLIPCPAALVLLLSCVAFGNVGLGLSLVLAFSLGLAGVLTGLGLLMVYAKQLFNYLPAPKRSFRFLPIVSALGITVIGIGLTAQAGLQLIKAL